MRTYLVDNGSLRADAVWALRRVAHELTERTGVQVEPLSVLHSSRIEAEDLGGQPAMVLRDAVEEALAAGERRLRLLPFFLGPSNAMLEYIPMMAGEWFARGDLRIEIAYPIFRDKMDAQFLASAVERAVGACDADVHWLLVDHGTPRVEVNRVREQVRLVLNERGRTVHACSMESREGEQYAFNLPLLKDCLTAVARSGVAQSLVIALLFLSPGRHAGSGGDVERLCEEVMKEFPHIRWRLSDVLGETPEVVRLLGSRVRELEAGDYWFSVG